jgi:hypothetical protein
VKNLLKINLHIKDLRTGVENLRRGAISSIQVIAPSRRGTDLSELACKCLSFLAREEGYRELMPTVVTDDVLRTLVICSEEPYVLYWGFRLLYNI